MNTQGKTKMTFTLDSPIVNIQLNGEISFRRIRVAYLRWKNTINDYSRIGIKLNQYLHNRDVDLAGNETRYLFSGFLGPGTDTLTIYTSQTEDYDYADTMMYTERFLRFEILLDGAIKYDIDPTNPVYLTLVFEQQ